MLAAALGIAPATAFAQNAAQQATGNTPAATTAPPPASNDTVGPRELQNFSLPGTTTTPAAPQSSPRPAASAPTPRSEVPAEQAPQTRTLPRPAARLPSRQASPPPAAVTARPSSEAPFASNPAQIPQGATLAPPVSSLPSSSAPLTPTVAVEPERQVSIWPWIAAGLALAGGAVFLWFRRRPREAYAAVPKFEAFAAADPVPLSPSPSPPPRFPVPQAEAPKPVSKPVSSGIVSSRLRPQLEVGVLPIRCIFSDDEIAIEFEVELLNAGSSPARAVFAEASLFNAGVGQEQDLDAFFSKMNSVGDRLDRIEPLKNVMLRSRVVAPRTSIQAYELGGRKSFVPLIGINALYEWAGGKGQTGAAFLVGRDSGAEKLGPLWLETASREIGGLGARILPIGRKS